MAMKSVCIIGAGPGGLVAAKTLLQTGGFDVTVYEQLDKIGGLWAFEPGAKGNYFLSADTPTNLSRFTVGFSDLAWTSVIGDKVPLFPRANQVGAYLEAYQRKYVPEKVIRLEHRVVRVDRVQEEAQEKWRVTTATRSGEQSVSVFDYLLNAAGFFNARRTLDSSMQVKADVQIIHTSEYRGLRDLFPSTPVTGKILLFGGGNSSGETAAQIAFHLSSAAHSEGTPASEVPKDVSIHHVTPRPLYGVPSLIPASADRCLFAPLDLQFYDLQWRPPGPIRSGSGPLPDAVTQARYTAIEGMVGDQQDLGSPALVTKERTTPYVVLADHYAEAVREGTIVPMAGRVTALHADTHSKKVTATVQTASGPTSLSDIAAVVHATGYSPAGAFAILPTDVQEALEYDASSPRLPVLLQQHQTMHPSVPNLAFVGFYEGPYWGVMEMQARVIARRWATGQATVALPDESLDKLRALRSAMKAAAPDIPQYWFSDYAGYMEELAADLGLERIDAPFTSPREGPVSAARYLAPADDHTEATATMADMAAARASAASGRWRARAVLRALVGTWKLERTIRSARPPMPSGVFRGTASFYLRQPSAERVDAELLYEEKGDFVTEQGTHMTASRRYVYRYVESSDELSVWFADPDQPDRAAGLFHVLAFGDVVPGWRCHASAEHMCEPDLYRSRYGFDFHTSALKSFDIEHTVTGPQKDYVANALFTRPGREKSGKP